MYDHVIILPLEQTVEQTVKQSVEQSVKQSVEQSVEQCVIIDGVRYKVSIPSKDHDLFRTYRRVGIFDFVDPETGRVFFRPDIRLSTQGSLRRASQFEYDVFRCAEGGFSGNALVFNEWKAIN